MPRSFLFATLCILLTFSGLPAPAQDRAAVDRQFRAWLSDTVWPRARRAGISATTFETALGSVRIDWDLPDLVLPGAGGPDTALQAEFRAPSRYFRPGALSGATATGRRMAARHAETLARIERDTGVPGRILLAVWGRESAYGQAALPHDAFRVLATKGFLSTRAAYFTDELIAALRLAEAGLPPSAMRSSWAGALGQPQFMPSSVLRHATDGDGDGRADIWGSEADTLASIAGYLAHHGWVRGRDWGFEIRLPDNVSCVEAGPDNARPIAEWERLGVTRVSGRPFPAHERGLDASLMLPAGRLGPAFLVTPNFYVLKDYNFSDTYALFVGHVGDRIAYGMGDFATRWQPTDPLNRGSVAAMQRALMDLGLDTGGADGLVGFRTRRALGQWQAATGRTETCFPDAAALRVLAR